MDDIKQLADSIYRSRVLRARQMRPEDKLLEGPRLFDFACRITMDGIRHQFPNASEAEVKSILFERIALKRRLEQIP